MSIIGGAIQAVGNIVGGAIQSKAQRKINEQNVASAREENQKSRDWQEMMYNKYESPTAQAQQLASAGINPYSQGNVSTQSVGSASTQSLPPAQAGNFGDAIGRAFTDLGANMPAIQELKQAKQQTKINELEIAKRETENKILIYDEMMKAIEAGNYEYATMLNNERIREDIRTSKASRKEKIQSRKNMEKEFDILVEEHKSKQRENRFGDAAEGAGVNPIIDTHKLSEAQTKLAEASANLNDKQRESVAFALALSKKYDDSFMDLSLQERQQQVKEFLDSADNRASMLQFAHDIQENAKFISNRLNAVDELQSQIMRDFLSAVKDGMSSDDLIDNIGAVFAYSYVNNPSGTLSAITNMLPDFTMNNNNKNTYSTTKNFGVSK